MLKKSLSVVIPLFLALVACNLSAAPASNTATPPPPVPPPAATQAPTQAPPVAPTSLPTSAGVTISVTSESLNVRRGPSTYYDPVGFIKAGESATATGRDGNSDWLYIPLPGDPSASGWVSAKTQYSQVSGDIQSLPVQSAPPAKPAYIRNCTYHPMKIQPGGILLQPLTDKSGRLAQFAPGAYSAFDQNVSNTKVLSMTLHEGDSVDIKTDGLKNTYGC